MYASMPVAWCWHTQSIRWRYATPCYGVERADEWGLQVSGWLQSCNDLVAEEALYYHNLYLLFTQHRNMVPESSKGGCLADPEMTGIWIYRWIFGVKFSGAGTGHRSGAKVGAPKYVFVGSKSTISRFGERFCDGQYSLISFVFSVFKLMVPPCPDICKIGGGTWPLCPMESAPLVKL